MCARDIREQKKVDVQKLFDEMRIVPQGLQEQCARQATLGFLERYPGIDSDGAVHHALLKAMALGFYCGYNASMLKAKG